MTTEQAFQIISVYRLDGDFLKGAGIVTLADDVYLLTSYEIGDAVHVEPLDLDNFFRLADKLRDDAIEAGWRPGQDDDELSADLWTEAAVDDLDDLDD